MKKKLAATLSVVLILGLAVLGILAYLTDTDSDVNVMTLGNVDIEQIEQEWKDGTLVDFTQEKPLYPYVGKVTWLDKEAGEYRQFAMNNVVDKYVSVKNKGESPAYVRTVFAFEMGTYDNVSDFRNKVIGVSRNSVDGDEFDFPGTWEWDTPFVAQIDGQNYMVWEAVHKNALTSEETTIPSLLQVYMNANCDNAEVEKVDGNGNGKYDILVLSQAVQTEGFADAETALDTAFGDVTEAKAIEWFTGMKPEVEVKGNDAAALTEAIAAAPEGGVVALTEDIDFGANTFTVDKAVEIDMNGKTATSTARNGVFYLKNGASLENGTVQHNGTVAAIKVWKSEGIENVDVILNGKSGSNNVITGISVQEGIDTYIKHMKNVTVKSTGDNKTYNGIETYNCGARTDLAIGDMENVKVDVNGTAFLLSAPAGTATNCEFKGGVCGINAHLKGAYNVSLKLVNSTVEGLTGIYAWDEPSKTNPGYLKLEGVNTTVTGGVMSSPAEEFGDRWSVNGLN